MALRADSVSPEREQGWTKKESDNMKQTLTRSKGGTAEREVPILSLSVPDLWHIAMRFNDIAYDLEKCVKIAPKDGKDDVIVTVEYSPSDIVRLKAMSIMVLDCWHLAHDMKTMLQEMLAESK
jgi:hypothetical protein